MPLMHLISTPQTVVDLSNDIYFLDHHKSQLSDYTVANFNRTVASLNTTFFNNVNLNLENKITFKAYSHTLNETAKKLRILTRQQDNMENNLYSDSSTHYILYTIIGVSVALLILVQIICISKTGSTKIINTTAQPQPAPRAVSSPREAVDPSTLSTDLDFPRYRALNERINLAEQTIFKLSSQIFRPVTDSSATLSNI